MRPLKSILIETNQLYQQLKSAICQEDKRTLKEELTRCYLELLAKRKQIEDREHRLMNLCDQLYRRIIRLRRLKEVIDKTTAKIDSISEIERNK